MQDARQFLDKIISGGSIVHLCRGQFPGGAGELIGRILSRSDELAAVHVLDDSLRLDGVEIVCIDDITEIDADFRRSFCEILERELGSDGLTEVLPTIESFQSILKWASERTVLVGICREFSSPQAFDIGYVRMVSSDNVVVDCYDPWGEPKKRSTRWAMDEITGILLGSHYLGLLSIVIDGKQNR